MQYKRETYYGSQKRNSVMASWVTGLQSVRFHPLLLHKDYDVQQI